MNLRMLAKYPNRLVRSQKVKMDQDIGAKLSALRQNGYVVMERFFQGQELKFLQDTYRQRLENDLRMELPCLAQTKIDETKHKGLIENYFQHTLEELARQGIAFDRSDIHSYAQLLNDFRPSTLKTSLQDIPEFLPFWLDERILDLIEAYSGLKPYLVEAYIRRNFPAKHRVMNHFWHRDRNNPDSILKAFIFLSDCEADNGPHEYVAGSVQDRRLDGKPYYSDEEVNAVYPEDGSRRVKSVVPAGTVVLEDTRGLHRATIPTSGFRDLGFAVFIPRPFYSSEPAPLYHLDISAVTKLTNRQKSYIPDRSLRNGQSQWSGENLEVK